MNKLFRADVSKDLKFLDDETCIVPMIDENDNAVEVVMSVDDAEEFVEAQVMLLTAECKDMN